MTPSKPLVEYLHEENLAKRYLAGLALLKEQRPQLPVRTVHQSKYGEPSYPLVAKYSLQAFWELMLIPVIASIMLSVVNIAYGITIGSITALMVLISTLFTYTGLKKQRVRGFFVELFFSSSMKESIKAYRKEHEQYFVAVQQYKKLVSEVRQEIQPFIDSMNHGSDGMFTYMNDMGKIVRLEKQASKQFSKKLAPII